MRKKHTLGLPVLASILVLGVSVGGITTANGDRRVATRSQRQPGVISHKVQFPFELICNHIVVSVRINDSKELDMLVDTGMPMKGVILLDEEIGEDLDLEYEAAIEMGGVGVEGTRTADVAFGATLSVGGIEFPDQRVFILRDADFADDWPAVGVIGGTFFEYVMEIDYEDFTIGLYPNVEDMPVCPDHELDLTFTMGIPVIEAGVVPDDDEVVPVTLIADTGVNDGLLLFAYADPGISVPENAIEGVNRILSEGLSGDIKGSVGRISELRLGPYALEDVVVAYPDEETMGGMGMLGQSGFVGNDVFKRFTVVFDYGGRHLYLEPNESYSEPFEWNMAGLIFGMTRDGFIQVKEVMRASPALEVGIKPDDVITEIDGRDVRDLGGEEITGLFTDEGRKIDLEIKRGPKRFAASLTLRRLI